MPKVRNGQPQIPSRIAIAVALVTALIFSTHPELLRSLLAWFQAGLAGKSSWEYIEVLLGPALTALLIWFLQKKEDERREFALSATHKQEALQKYFDSISMTDGSPTPPEMRAALRCRTLSMLKYFASDLTKKDSIISFLLEAGIIPAPDFCLKGADFAGVNLKGCLAFRSADLEGIDLSNAMLERAEFINATFSRFGGGRSTLAGACLVWADLSLAKLDFCILDNANLSLSTLNDAELNYASLCKANLGGATLFNTKLRKADLRGADLRSALLGGADLRGARLQGATLCGANLSFNNLRALKLNIAAFKSAGSADLEDADLLGIEWDGTTRWPPPEILAKAKNIPEKLRRQFKFRI